MSVSHVILKIVLCMFAYQEGASGAYRAGTRSRAVMLRAVG